MKYLGLRIRAARKLHGYSTEKLGQVSEELLTGGKIKFKTTASIGH